MSDFFSKYFKYILLAALVYMPVFGFLDTQPIRIWDESRIAINAFEMYHDRDFIVTHCNYEHETWNTKPPLLIWMQVFFMDIVGVNEIAIRLPSAMAAFFTCLALLLFSTRYLKDFWFGFITVIVLVTTGGYINAHVTRTGEYDALLALFTAVSGLFFYAFCETKQNKYLYWFFVALTLAVLTKGIAGLLFCPALLIYCLVRKDLKFFLKNKHFYAGLIGFIVLVLGYYLLREIKDPGYIASVRENELGGRFLKVQGDLHNDFWFYYHNFANERLSDRYFLVPIGLLIGFFSKNKRLQRFTLFVFIMAITFFLVISSAQTRLEQYDAPLFPFLAILIALVVHFIFEQIKNIKQINLRLRTQVLPYLFLFLVFMLPYKKIWDKTYLPGEKYWDAEFYEIGYLLKDAVKGEYDFNFKYLLYDGYNAQNIFYLRVLWNKGVYTGFRYPNEILVNDTIIVCQESMKRYIQEHFISEETFRKGHIVFYKIKGKITHASKSGS